MSKHVAIVGATGAVGDELLRILAERDFPVASLRPLASARSAGKTVTFKGESVTVEELTKDSFTGIDIAFFSAGGSISKALAAPAVESGAVVIDNTSHFRMKDGIPLVVPEVNPEATHKHMGLIANPNCSTIIMAVPVWPLFKAFRLKRIAVSTYQAVSGAGAAGLEELERQTRQHVAGEPITKEKFAYPVVHNVFSHDSAVDPDTGRNVEEQKMIDETAKIFATDKLGVSATCIRVPVPRTHCESINLEFAEAVTPEQVREVLAAAPGIKIVDDRAANHFPMPTEASNQDDVLVGRIRQDSSRPDGRGIDLFVAGDQIRKGAATNAVQIAELL
ncbi:MAG: aspartate-semialdehyde dehydrogenase [Planctomycetota bacterium]